METSCPICYEEYNLSTRLPRITLVCGHTFCTTCLENITKSKHTSKCPLDKINLPYNGDIGLFPINYALKSVIEAKMDSDTCLHHGDPLVFLCTADKQKICCRCLEDQHQGHPVQTLKTIKIQADKQSKEIKLLSQKVKESQKEAGNIIETRRNIQLARIEAERIKLSKALNYRSQCLKAQANLLFMMEKDRVDGLIGDKSTLFGTIVAKEASLENVMKPEELGKYEDLTFGVKSLEDQYQAIVSSDALEKNINEELRQVNLFFDDAFVKQRHAVMMGDASKPNLKLFGLTKMMSHFSFIYNNYCLTIQNAFENPQNTEIDLKLFAGTHEVAFILEKKVQEADFDLLTVVWDSLQGVTSLRLKFSDDTVTNKLYRILCSNERSFKKIELDITEYTVMDECSTIISFIRDLFLNAKNIETIVLVMENIKIAEKCVEKIFEGGIIDASELKEFSLNLNGTMITDEDIKNVFVRMPKLRIFDLKLEATEVTDETLISCAQNTLLSAQSIEGICIDVYNTNITDMGVGYLCRSLTNIRILKLQLELGLTQITDRTIELLSGMMVSLDLYNTLEAFGLGLSYCKISDIGLGRLFRPMPNVRDFYLSLYSTQITDKVIQQYIREYFLSMKILEHVQILLGNTKLTDDCLDQLLKSLRDSKRYSLGLESTMIKDKSLETFVESKLDAQSICQEMEIFLTGTGVSNGLQDKIRQVSEVIAQKKMIML